MKKVSILALIFCILTTSTFTYANSGPTYWKGYPSSEVLAIEKDSPIEVKREDLIFDFTKEQYLKHHAYSISGRVTAKYTMSNGTENNQIVQMAFPFISSIQDFNPKAIDIKVNNKEMPFKVFMGDKFDDKSREEDNVKQLDFSSIVKGISRSEYTPTNYDLDEIGTLYTYDVTPKGDDEINIAINYSYDHEKSKILSKGFNGLQMEDEIESLTAWVRGKGGLEIFLLGEDVDFDFNAYLDGELKNKTDKYSLDIRTQEMSIREYLMKEVEMFESEVHYLDYLADNQIFNLAAKRLDEMIEHNVVNLWIDDLFADDYRGRFFVLVYTVDFQPYKTNDISVSYDSRGAMDKRKTAEPIYTFDYILNPAKNWASFSNLNIEIRPPAKYPYIINSNIDLIRKENGIYIGSFESLPEEDLFFCLYHNEKITIIDKIKGFLMSNFYILMPWLLGSLIGLIIRGVFRRFKRQQKN